MKTSVLNGALLVGLLLTMTSAARAESIFVDRSSPAGLEDGSAAAPFKTITRALDVARKIRFGVAANGVAPSQKMIKVHVAPGTYVGSFATSEDPLVEKLPILLNVPRLKLCGALRFDDLGEVVSGTETVLRPTTRQGTKQHLMVLTRTKPTVASEFPTSMEMAGDAVTVSGFYIDGWAADGTKPNATNAQSSALISLDGISDFVIRENYLNHAGAFGISARLASGRIEANLIENGGLASTSRVEAKRSQQ